MFYFPKANLDDLTHEDTVRCYRWIQLCDRLGDCTRDEVSGITYKGGLTMDKVSGIKRRYYKVCSKVGVKNLLF